MQNHISIITAIEYTNMKELKDDLLHLSEPIAILDKQTQKNTIKKD